MYVQCYQTDIKVVKEGRILRKSNNYKPKMTVFLIYPKFLIHPVKT